MKYSLSPVVSGLRSTEVSHPLSWQNLPPKGERMHKEINLRLSEVNTHTLTWLFRNQSFSIWILATIFLNILFFLSKRRFCVLTSERMRDVKMSLKKDMGQDPWFLFPRDKGKSRKGKPRNLTFKWLNFLSSGSCNADVIYLAKDTLCPFLNKYSFVLNKWLDTFDIHKSVQRTEKVCLTLFQPNNKCIDDFVLHNKISSANNFISKIQMSFKLKY